MSAVRIVQRQAVVGPRIRAMSFALRLFVNETKQICSERWLALVLSSSTTSEIKFQHYTISQVTAYLYIHCPTSSLSIRKLQVALSPSFMRGSSDQDEMEKEIVATNDGAMSLQCMQTD
jgi:hypothetical protein